VKEWFSARELAGLPSLPSTERRVRMLAARNRWSSRQSQSSGGRPSLEFHCSNLQEAARVALAEKIANSDCFYSPAEVQREFSPRGRAFESRSRRQSQNQVCADRGAHSLTSDERDAPQLVRAKSLQAAAVPISSTPRDRLADEARSNSSRAEAVAARNYITLSDSARARADAKAELLALFASFHRIAKTSLDVATHDFAKAYNAGQIKVTDATRAAMRGRALAAKTLRDWRREAKKSGFARLGGNYGNRAGSGLIDSTPAIRDLIISMITHQPHLRASHVYDGVKERFRGGAIPSFDQVKRFIKRWKDSHGPELLAIANPDAYKSRHRLAIADFGADIVRPNQEWQIDGTPGDVMASDGRYYVMTVIDVFTRRAMVLITKTATAVSAALLIRRAIKAWGVPETIHGDNGKEFVAHHLQRVLMDLGIDYVASTPFSPEQKPFIERFNGTLMHGLFEMLPGYIGHNVAERKGIEARRTFAARLGDKNAARFNVELSAESLQIKCDEWCSHIYGERPHSGLAGRTPNQIAALWIEQGGEVRRIENERAVDLLLGSGEVRVVGKEGIRVAGARFFAIELVPFVGKHVLAIADDDMGRLYVYSENPREFICVAKNLDRMGQSRTDMAILAKQAQTRLVSEMRKSTRRMKARIKPELVADEVIARAVANGSETPTGESVVHQTAALIAAEAAHEADIASLTPRKPKYDAERLEEGRQILHRLSQRRPVDDRDEDEADWQRFKHLSGRAEISEEERAWMRSFQDTSVYRGRMLLERARGPRIAQVG
jgi:putative transposase